jgi:filamentous hemagglutinin family protein
MGPDYEISSQYGTQAGSNLFHSFLRFNVHSGENAAFTGPSSVQNIISRITGGEASWIDGQIRCAIPGADLYMLNPSGVLFGPGASLDVKGSFHVSTADYLRLGQSDRFYSKFQNGEVLSTAPPSAFGFLDNTTASISIDGRGKISQDEWFRNPSSLQVPEGETLSVIGGDIWIKKGTVIQTGDQTASAPNLGAAEGRINLAAVASPGEVVPGESGMDVSSFGKMGTVRLSDASLVSTAGDVGGSVYIYGMKIAAENDSLIHLSAQGSSPGNSGRLLMEAGDILFTGGASILANTFGQTQGPDVDLKASGSVEFSGEGPTIPRSQIAVESSNTGDGGNAGNLVIQAENVSFKGGAAIFANTEGQGRGGNVTIKASKKVTFSGENSQQSSSQISLESRSTVKKGDAGNLLIEAGDISLEKGASIFANTNGAGQGGNVTLKAGSSVTLSGENIAKFPSQIIMQSKNAADGGNAGDLLIQSTDISLKDGALIYTSTDGKGTGGDIGLASSGTVQLSGRSSQNLPSRILLETHGTAANAGRSGNLAITAGKAALKDGANITARTTGKGAAGNLSLTANEVLLSGGTLLTSKSDAPAGGGNAGAVVVKAAQSLDITGLSGIMADAANTGAGKVEIEAVQIQAEKSLVSAGVKTGSGNAGNIKITGQAVALTTAQITANAVSGSGGIVHLTAVDQFDRSSDTRIEAKSVSGTQGTVRLDVPAKPDESPQIEDDQKEEIANTIVTGDETSEAGAQGIFDAGGQQEDDGGGGSYEITPVPPTDLRQALRWTLKDCSARIGKPATRLTVAGRDATPSVFDDWRKSPVFGFKQLGPVRAGGEALPLANNAISDPPSCNCLAAKDAR